MSNLKVVLNFFLCRKLPHRLMALLKTAMIGIRNKNSQEIGHRKILK
jgi:hypothetical protein